MLDEIVGAKLAKLAPPYKPQQDPKSYLRDVVRAMLATSRLHPKLGRLVALHLSDDPLLSPIFAERVCATLAAIGKAPEIGLAYPDFISRLVGLILDNTAKWLAGEPAAVRASVLKRASPLSGVEFPTLTLASEKLADEMMKRCTAAASGNSDAIADAAVTALIAELESGGD